MIMKGNSESKQLIIFVVGSWKSQQGFRQAEVERNNCPKCVWCCKVYWSFSHAQSHFIHHQPSGGKQVQRGILKKDMTGFVCNWKGRYEKNPAAGRMVTLMFFYLSILMNHSACVYSVPTTRQTLLLALGIQLWTIQTKPFAPIRVHLIKIMGKGGWDN